MVLGALGIERVDMRDRLDVCARQIPWEPFPACSDTKLAFGQIDELDACFQRQSERAEAAVGINAVAIEFARPAGGEHDHPTPEQRDAQRVLLRAVTGAHRDYPDDVAVSAIALGE